MHGETQPQHAIDITFLAKISTRKQPVSSRESLSSCSKIFFTDDRKHIQKWKHHPRKAIKKALQDQGNKIFIFIDNKNHERSAQDVMV